MVRNIAECVRKLRTDFERGESPSAPYVRYLVKKVKETGILIGKPKREKPKTVRTPENIAAVSRGIIGPFFFENEQGVAVTVNGDRYRAMLNEFLFTKTSGYTQKKLST